MVNVNSLFNFWLLIKMFWLLHVANMLLSLENKYLNCCYLNIEGHGTIFIIYDELSQEMTEKLTKEPFYIIYHFGMYIEDI